VGQACHRQKEESWIPTFAKANSTGMKDTSMKNENTKITGESQENNL
jgi:hypothetical protein